MTMNEIQSWLDARARGARPVRSVDRADTGSTAMTTLRHFGDRGQATAEYALVLLGAAAVAMLLSGWALKTGKVGSLLNAIVDQLASHVR